MAFALGLGFTAAFAAAGAESPRSASTIAAARGYVDRGDLTHAGQLLLQLRHDEPDNDEALLWLAEIALAAEQYEKATALFTEVLSRDPQNITARHRRWLAYLAQHGPKPENRARVRREIEQLLQDSCTTAACLYIAYRGYKYLWDRARRGALMLRLVPLTAGDSAADELVAGLPAELLEEILQARAPLRARLVEAFLKYFPRRRGIELASRIYLDSRIATGLTLEQLAVLLRRYPGNRHLRLQAVPWLLQQRQPAAARSVLAEYASLYRQQFAAERAWYADPSGWRQINDWERAEQQYLSGRLAMAEGDWTAAARDLQAALAAHAKPWRVWAALAQTYMQQRKRGAAIEAWRQSISLGNTQAGAQNTLAELLRETGTTDLGPAAYFASRSGVMVFEDVTGPAGFADIKSSRAAWGDFDNDGDADLLLDGPRILLNEQGRFIDRTVGLGVDPQLKTTGGLWVDVDNDGWLDLWLSAERANYVYKNTGGGFFDASAEIFPQQVFAGRTEAAAWGDVNNDGWLDLYTANYEKRGLERGMCYRDQLFLNAHGRLRDAGLELGVHTDAPLCGRGVLWTDLDGDGRQDIVVANYRVDRNLVWRNKDNGFTEAAHALGLSGRLRNGAYGNSIGFDVADVVGDPRFELYLSNLAHPRYIDVTDTSQLLVGAEDHYTDRRAELGVAYEESSADPVFADFDNDGDMDLYVSSVYPRALSHLHRNEGGRFVDVTWLSGTRVDNAWGVAVADYDSDGDLDLLVARPHGVRLFRNAGPRGHWLQVAVRSTLCNRFGVGAQVRVRSQGLEQRRELHLGRGSGSQDELIAHFGFAASPADPVEVTVRDLCGGRARILSPLDRRIIVETVPSARREKQPQ